MGYGFVVHLRDLICAIGGTLLVIHLDLELLLKIIPALVIWKTLIKWVILLEVRKHRALYFVLIKQLLCFFTQYRVNFRGMLYSEPTLLSHFQCLSISNIWLRCQYRLLWRILLLDRINFFHFTKFILNYLHHLYFILPLRRLNGALNWAFISFLSCGLGASVGRARCGVLDVLIFCSLKILRHGKYSLPDCCWLHE